MLVGQLVVVDAVDDGEVDALGRRGNQNLLSSRGDVLFGARAVGEETGALERDLDAVGGVRKVGRVLLGADVNSLAVDDDVVAVGRDLARIFAVDAVVLEQPGVGLCVGEVVDADQLEPAVRTLKDRPGDQAADAAEAVDCNFGHWIPRCFMKSVTRCAILSDVRPK